MKKQQRAMEKELKRLEKQERSFLEKRMEKKDSALIRQAAGGLSKELLYMKFLQGVPLVGAVGGAYDAVYMKRIMAYAELKYRRRFYYDKIKLSS